MLSVLVYLSANLRLICNGDRRSLSSFSNKRTIGSLIARSAAYTVRIWMTDRTVLLAKSAMSGSIVPAMVSRKSRQSATTSTSCAGTASARWRTPSLHSNSDSAHPRHPHPPNDRTNPRSLSVLRSHQSRKLQKRFRMVSICRACITTRLPAIARRLLAQAP